MGDPLTIGLQLGREVLAVATGKALETLLGALGADECSATWVWVRMDTQKNSVALPISDRVTPRVSPLRPKPRPPLYIQLRPGNISSGQPSRGTISV